NPLPAAFDERWKSAREGVSHIQVAGHRRPLIDDLEDSNVGCVAVKPSAPAPGHVIVRISLGYIRAIRLQRSAGRDSVRAPLKERLIKRSAVVRSITATATITHIAARKARVVSTQVAVGVREHPKPVLADA